MIICICANINEASVRKGLEQMSLDEFKDATGACKNCCKCCDELKRIEYEVSSLRLQLEQ